MGELAPPRPVWVDTDLALGAPRGDVDDGWALALLLRSPSVRVLGVSTVFGNTDVDTATRCVKALLAIAGAPASGSVVAGAPRPGQPGAAHEAIAALPAGTRVLALGPLTNVAQALARDPGLAQRIEVSLVGGNFASRGRWPPLWPLEFNLAKDAGAARTVFAESLRRRLFPLDVCRKLAIGPAALRRMHRGTDLSRYLVRHSLRWLAYAPLRYRSLRFPLWDVVPALDAGGTLAGVREVGRRLRIEGRGLAVEDPEAGPTDCVEDFDPAAGLAAILRTFAAD